MPVTEFQVSDKTRGLNIECIHCGVRYIIGPQGERIYANRYIKGEVKCSACKRKTHILDYKAMLESK